MDYALVTVKARRIRLEVDADQQLNELAAEMLVFELKQQLNSWEDRATRYYARKRLLCQKFVNHFAVGWEPDFRFEVCKVLRQDCTFLTDLR
jgi:hypothetical protein